MYSGFYNRERIKSETNSIQSAMGEGKHTVLRVYQFSSVAQSCSTLCDPMNGSMPGLPVHHQLPEFTQIHVH